MEIQRCPHCRIRVMPSAEGRCPSCQRNVLQPPGAGAETQPVVNVDVRTFQRRRSLCALGNIVAQCGWLGLAAMLVGPAFDAWLRRETWLESESLRCFAISMLALGCSAILACPVAFYADFVLEHRCGLSNQTAERWMECYLRRNVCSGVHLSAILTGAYLFACAGAYWWLVVAALGVGTTIWGIRRRPAFFGPYYHLVEPLDDPDLAESAARLLEESGFQIEGLYRVRASDDTVRPNAYLYGIGNKRRLLITDTLLQRFTPEEIDVILAHEVGHIVHRHIPKGIAIYAVWLCMGLLLCEGTLCWLPAHRDTLGYADLPASDVLWGLLVFSLWAAVTSPLLRAVNRFFERQSDRYAFGRAKSAACYRSAIAKLTQLNGEALDPNPWEVLWLHDHPPPAQRIALADAEATHGA